MHSVLLFSFLSFDLVSSLFFFLHAQSIIASSIRIDFVLYTHIDTSISIKAHINRIESLMIYNTYEIQFIPFSSELSVRARSADCTLPLFYWLAFTENESGQRVYYTQLFDGINAQRQQPHMNQHTFRLRRYKRRCSYVCWFHLFSRALCVCGWTTVEKIHLFECVNIRPFRFA